MKKPIAIALMSVLPIAYAAAAGDIEAGKEKAEAICQQCHGPGGVSPNPTFPHLAGQHASYIAKVLEDYKSGARKNAIMAGFSGTLTKEDRENLGAYYQSQQKLYDIEYTK